MYPTLDYLTMSAVGLTMVVSGSSKTAPLMPLMCVHDGMIARWNDCVIHDRLWFAFSRFDLLSVCRSVCWFVGEAFVKNNKKQYFSKAKEGQRKARVYFMIHPCNSQSVSWSVFLSCQNLMKINING